LADKKFVKVLNKGDPFLKEDAQRFLDKPIHYLYLAQADALTFIKHFEDYLTLMEGQTETSAEAPKIALEAFSSIELLGKGLGWPQETVETARKTVGYALKAISRESNIYALLKAKMTPSTSNYSRHIGRQALFLCAFCQHMGWTHQETQMKLSMAALLHDVVIDESMYEDIRSWNTKALNPSDKSPEVVKYRNHPADAAILISKLKNLPPDVDSIILQHHEKADGTGFPRSLSSARVSPLAAFFIIMEDLITFLDEKDISEELVSEFLQSHESLYASGNFKKVFRALKESLEK
jgi:response regulator RpfG family c-di-GMP phosphodiesterase